MNSETDHPRQRTVAELLAQHGDSGATGRRRRRREADVPDDDEVSNASEGTAVASPAHTAHTAVPAPAPTLPPVTGPPHGEAPRGPQPEPPAPFDGGPDRTVWREAVPREAVPREAVPREAMPREAMPREAANPAGPYADPVAEVPRQAPSALASSYFEPVVDPLRQGSPLPARRPPDRTASGSRLDRPTDMFPMVRSDGPGVSDLGSTGPIERQWSPPPPERPIRPLLAPDAPHGPDGVDAGPPTMTGVAPAGAEAWHRDRTSHRPGEPLDGGPPTEAAAPMDFDSLDGVEGVDDRPAGLGATGMRGAQPAGPHDGDRTQATHFPARTGAGPDVDATDAEPEDESQPQPESERRLGRSAVSSPGQAWMAVVVQWIVGAVGGAALWVGFRFLWREFPVVALAAAVLVTVGLVLLVRALLRNNALRTTIFAVFVGLLLTVSPAILVLLGR